MEKKDIIGNLNNQRYNVNNSNNTTIDKNNKDCKSKQDEKSRRNNK